MGDPISRRAFVLGALLCGCRACSGAPKKPVTLPPWRLLYEARPARIRAFVAGDRTHHFIEVASGEGGAMVASVRALDRATRALRTIASGVEAYTRELARSDGYLWFRVGHALARARVAGGPVETLFTLPEDLHDIAADAGGAYAFRATREDRGREGAELVRVPDAGAPKTLASDLYPTDEPRLAVWGPDVAFHNVARGVLAVPKAGGAPRAEERAFDHEIVQRSSAYRVDPKELVEIDPATGLARRTVLPFSLTREVLGVSPAGVVLVRSGRSSAPLGASGAPEYGLDFFDLAAGDEEHLTELREGTFVGGGETPDGLVWAAEREIGEIG